MTDMSTLSSFKFGEESLLVHIRPCLQASLLLCNYCMVVLVLVVVLVVVRTLSCLVLSCLVLSYLIQDASIWTLECLGFADIVVYMYTCMNRLH